MVACARVGLRRFTAARVGTMYRALLDVQNSGALKWQTQV